MCVWNFILNVEARRGSSQAQCLGKELQEVVSGIAIPGSFSLCKQFPLLCFNGLVLGPLWWPGLVCNSLLFLNQPIFLSRNIWLIFLLRSIHLVAHTGIQKSPSMTPRLISKQAPHPPTNEITASCRGWLFRVSFSWIGASAPFVICSFPGCLGWNDLRLRLQSPLSFSEIPPPLSSPDPVSTCVFTKKSSGALEAKSVISYILWTTANVPDIINDFPKVTEDAQRLARNLTQPLKLTRLVYLTYSIWFVCLSVKAGSALD